MGPLLNHDGMPYASPGLNCTKTRLRCRSAIYSLIRISFWCVHAEIRRCGPIVQVYQPLLPTFVLANIGGEIIITSSSCRSVTWSGRCYARHALDPLPRWVMAFIRSLSRMVIIFNAICILLVMIIRYRAILFRDICPHHPSQPLPHQASWLHACYRDCRCVRQHQVIMPRSSGHACMHASG